MRDRLLLAFVLALVCVSGLAVACGDDGGDDVPEPTETSEPGPTDAPDATATEGATTPDDDEMSLASSAFENNGAIPVQYTCDGDNISPPLDISGVPDDAVALALVMHDPDAPVEGGFTHWVVWNIDPSTTEVPEDSVPRGGVAVPSTRPAGYTGPCPPSGTHRYVFTLYAWEEVPTLPAGPITKDVIESAIQGGGPFPVHVLAQAELVGTYGR